MVEKVLKDVKRIEKTSKAGRRYQVLLLTFSNGYSMEVFLSNEQQYILSEVPLLQE